LFYKILKKSIEITAGIEPVTEAVIVHRLSAITGLIINPAPQTAKRELIPKKEENKTAGKIWLLNPL
jgi:hypothetical protein